jgi:hypothetical protein
VKRINVNPDTPDNDPAAVAEICARATPPPRLSSGVVTETLSQAVERQAREIERLRDDRDSWADQADARVKDCVEYLAEIERLRGLLKEVADGYLRATYGSSHEDVAQINDLWRKVREALQ